MIDYTKINDKLILDRPLIKNFIGIELTYKVIDIDNNIVTIFPTFKTNKIILKQQSSTWKLFRLNGWYIIKE